MYELEDQVGNLICPEETGKNMVIEYGKNKKQRYKGGNANIWTTGVSRDQKMKMERKQYLKKYF